MDLQSNSQPESGRLKQIVSQFLLKSLRIILDSRIPSLRPHDRSGDLWSASRVKKSDKWFSLVLGDHPPAMDDLNFWRTNLSDPMIIDIILVHEGPSSSSVDNLYDTSPAGAAVETVIERWVVQHECPRIMAHPSGEGSANYNKIYKKSIILLRSLYSTMRLLPAYRIFRQLSSSSQNYNFNISYKVSSFSDPFSRAEEEVMKEYSFVPVETFPGRLCISVTYRPTLFDFNLEPSTSLPPMIITDYVGSPATDPIRSFPSENGIGATSFPLRAIQPPSSAPYPRPHSWSGGFHRAASFAQNQHLSGSPPAYRASLMSYDFPSPSPPDIYGHRVQNYRPPTHHKATSFDEYQLSPPFSPSPSPSPPTYNFSGNPLQSRLRSETAPVTIPLPMMGRSSRYLSPNSSDPSRHSLPPPSPRKLDPPSQESPSGIRSFRKTDALRAGELYSGSTNHYSSLKVFRDSKDDSGRFSGLLSSSGSPRIGFSRSSSRLSFQDDLDDCDFTCPFDVDDVDTSDSHARHNLDGNNASEFTSSAYPIGKKSQGAAVGELVHMLRTAPPLRQDPSCYSSHSLKPELEGEVSTASGFFMPRKTADALEELRSYREMKDLLLSKSGTRVISKEV